MAEGLAYLIARFRWYLLAVWLVALGAAGVAALPLPGLLSGGGWYVPGSESHAVAAALRSGFVGRGASNVVLVVRDDRSTTGSAEFGQRIGKITREVRGDARLEATSAYGWATLSGAAGTSSWAGMAAPPSRSSRCALTTARHVGCCPPRRRGSPTAMPRPACGWRW